MGKYKIIIILILLHKSLFTADFFLKNIGPQTGIYFSYIKDIHIDSAGTFWIGTDKFLYKFYSKSNYSSFDLIKGQPDYIKKIKKYNDTLYILTDQNILYKEPTNDNFHIIKLPDNLHYAKNFCRFNNKLFFSEVSSISILNLQDSSFKRINLPENETFGDYSKSYFYFIFNKKLFAISLKGYIYEYLNNSFMKRSAIAAQAKINAISDNYKNHLYLATNKGLYYIENNITNIKKSNININNIITMAKFDRNNLVIVNNKNQLYMYNTKQDSIIDTINYKNNKESIKNIKIYNKNIILYNDYDIQILQQKFFNKIFQGVIQSIPHGKNIFFSNGNAIFSLKNNKVHKLIDFARPIITNVLNDSNKLYISTNKSIVYRLKNDNKILDTVFFTTTPLTNIQFAFKLNKNLYIYLNNNSLLINISQNKKIPLNLKNSKKIWYCINEKLNQVLLYNKNKIFKLINDTLHEIKLPQSILIKSITSYEDKFIITSTNNIYEYDLKTLNPLYKNIPLDLSYAIKIDDNTILAYDRAILYVLKDNHISYFTYYEGLIGLMLRPQLLKYMPTNKKIYIGTTEGLFEFNLNLQALSKNTICPKIKNIQINNNTIPINYKNITIKPDEALNITFMETPLDKVNYFKIQLNNETIFTTDYKIQILPSDTNIINIKLYKYNSGCIEHSEPINLQLTIKPKFYTTKLFYLLSFLILLTFIYIAIIQITSYIKQKKIEKFVNKILYKYKNISQPYDAYKFANKLFLIASKDLLLNYIAIIKFDTKTKTTKIIFRKSVPNFSKDLTLTNINFKQIIAEQNYTIQNNYFIKYIFDFMENHYFIIINTNITKQKINIMEQIIDNIKDIIKQIMVITEYRKEKTILEHLINFSPFMTIILNSNWDILYINDSFKKYFLDLNNKDITKIKNLKSINQQYNMKFFNDLINKFDKPYTYNKKIKFINKNNEEKYLEEILIQLELDQKYFMAIYHDITDDVLYENLIKQENINTKQLLELHHNFLANISHELKTPLNGLLGAISLINKKNLATQDIELLNIIKESGLYLNRLITDIIHYINYKKGDITLSEKEFTFISLYDKFYKKYNMYFDISYDISSLNPNDIFLGDSEKIDIVLSKIMEILYNRYKDVKIKIYFTIKTSSHNETLLVIKIISNNLKYSIFNNSSQIDDIFGKENYKNKQREGDFLSILIAKNYLNILKGQYTEHFYEENKKFETSIEIPIKIIKTNNIHNKKMNKESIYYIDSTNTIAPVIKQYRNYFNLHEITAELNNTNIKENSILLISPDMLDKVSQLDKSIKKYVYVENEQQIATTIKSISDNNEINGILLIHKDVDFKEELNTILWKYLFELDIEKIEQKYHNRKFAIEICNDTINELIEFANELIANKNITKNFINDIIFKTNNILNTIEIKQNCFGNLPTDIDLQILKLIIINKIINIAIIIKQELKKGEK